MKIKDIIFSDSKKHFFEIRTLKGLIKVLTVLFAELKGSVPISDLKRDFQIKERLKVAA